MKTYEQLVQENEELQNQLDKSHDDYRQAYGQVNKLLMWKSALKVKVNEACPFADIVGKEGFIGDLFPDGFTVWHIKEDGESTFWRLEADWLDVVEWDMVQFEKNMTGMKCTQTKGIWTCKG